VCVDAFHDGAIRFPDIVDTVARVVERHDGAAGDAGTVDGVLEADAWARGEAVRLVAS
jgi:1-deoxy-D-xylulose-5-phosphate reductoisomerase